MYKYLLSTTLLIACCVLSAQTYSLGGYITTINDSGVGEVQLEVVDPNGTTVGSLMTDCDGAYTFDNLEAGTVYTLHTTKDGSVFNGNTAFDLVLIAKHLLGSYEIDNPFQLAAADNDESGHVSVADLLWLQSVILAVEVVYPGENWLFFRPADTQPRTSFEFVLTGDVFDFDLISVKKGDVNDSANPCN